MRTKHVHACAVCKQKFSEEELFPVAFMGDAFVASIKKFNPDLTPDSFICTPDLNHFKSLYVQDILQAEIGALSEIEKEVSESFQSLELLSANTNEEYEQQLTFGEHLADRLTEIAGSWTFIIGFHAFLGAWVLLNTLQWGWKVFDPYPYILLNLILSCLAAIQAPIIMMSQNRREDRDRLRAENDYQVNLKAEMEIRHINMKLDAIIKHQWRPYQQIEDIQQYLRLLIEEAKEENNEQ